MRKIFSLSGIVPVGFFVVLHLWTNAQAPSGPEAFVRAASRFAHVPPVLEVVGIGLPLAFHALYGVRLALGPRRSADGAAHGFLQRLNNAAAFVALVFIALHVYELRIRHAGASSQALFDVLSSRLSTTWGSVPWLAIGYLFALGATLFHFAYGLYTFLVAWRIAKSDVARKRTAWLSGAIGALLFVVGANTVLYFATGAHFLSSGEDVGSTPDATCPPK